MTAATELAARTDNRHAAAATAPPKLIRVLAVDDHPAVRRALRGLLEEQPDFELVAVVDTPHAAILASRDGRIDVAVVDHQLGARHDGLWLCRELKRLPDPPKVLIYSAYCDGLLAAASVVVRADGILSKGGLGWQLCDAIRSITHERLPLPMTPRQLEYTIRRRLSDEDRLIFGMFLNGMSSDEVAQVVGCAPGSLDARVSRMLRELRHVPQPTARSARVLDAYAGHLARAARTDLSGA